jgi:autotransporter-associated beta strand protein
MKRIITLPVSLALLICAASLTSHAVIYFNDTFVNGSTLTNAVNTPATTNSTSYQISSSKTMTSTNSLPGFLKFGIASTTGGGIEIQALFTTNPIAMVAPNSDFIRLTVVFTNEAGLLTAAGALGFGLFNANQVEPIPGGALNNHALMAEATYVTGGVQDWQGYWGNVGFTNSDASRVLNRAAQTGGPDNRNQNLTSTGSGSQSYNTPPPVIIGPSTSSNGVALTAGAVYTEVLTISLIAANTLAITNTFYNGPDTNGAVLTQFGGLAAGPTNVTSAFDAIGIGWRARGATTGGTVIDISSIKIDGTNTVVTTPPDIVQQPVDVTLPNGASCPFQVVANGFGMTYQWHRYGTNLPDGGNIAGATTDTLIVSPASAADQASGANGYWVTVTGTGGYQTNSAKASLTLGTAHNLIWSGAGNVWDLNTTANFLDNGNPATFNYGDAVTFDDTAPLRNILLNNSYLSASSVTVNSANAYTFAAGSTGGFAGLGQLIYIGGNQLTVANANTYSGGTIISNSTALLRLQNYNGLGTGPVTFAKAGGEMEVLNAGSATIGIPSDMNVQDDFTIKFDGTGSFAGVIFGGINGVAGKTLIMTQPDLTTTNRYRIYGNNTAMDSALEVDGAIVPYPPVNGTTLSFYHSSGSQIYNGVISGAAALISRASGLTVLNGQNTYSGGTIPTTGTFGLGADSTPTVGTVTSGPLGTGPLFVVPELPNTTGNGTVLAFGGARTVGNPIQYLSGTNNQTLIVGGTNALTLTGPVTLNGIDGPGNATNRIFQMNNTALTTLSGIISDGGQGFGFVKTGTGVLALASIETYTGPTLISNGVLRVNGSLAAGSAVTVATNGTLGGTGTINGTVTVLNGGAIAPGASIGTLTINNNLSLAGNLTIEVNKTNSQTSDQTVVSGTLANTGVGTINVANLGPALAQGDTFALFNKAVSGGGSMTVTGGGRGVNWTNKLAVDGSISVLSVISLAPTSITISNIAIAPSSRTMSLNWPTDHTGWTLQTQTNGFTAGTWSPVTGSTATNQMVITIDPTKGPVFFRLLAPQ